MKQVITIQRTVEQGGFAEAFKEALGVMEDLKANGRSILYTHFYDVDGAIFIVFAYV